MDKSSIEHQLRQLKRRRIEIRSRKAALDLEDLDLDDKQSQLEGLLDNPNFANPVHTVETGAATNNKPRQSIHPNANTANRTGFVRPDSGALFNPESNLRAIKAPVEFAKVGVTEEQCPSANLATTEHFPSAERSGDVHSSHANVTDDDVVMVGYKKKLSSQTRDAANTISLRKRKRSPLWKAGFGQSLSPDPVSVKKAKTGPVLEKRSRIVTLKVRVDPRILQSKNIQNRVKQMSKASHPTHPGQTHKHEPADDVCRHLRPRLRSPVPTVQPAVSGSAVRSPPLKENTISSNFDLNFASPRQVKRHFQKSSHPVLPDPTLTKEKVRSVHRLGPASTTSSTSSTSRYVTQSPSRSASSSQHSASVSASASPPPCRTDGNQACPCSGRNPDCRLCRGTPAAIAESRSFLTRSSASKPNSLFHGPPQPRPGPDMSPTSHTRSVRSQFHDPTQVTDKDIDASPSTKHKAGPKMTVHSSPGQHLVSPTFIRTHSPIQSHGRVGPQYPRPRPAPSTYLIPAFEEMTPTERHDLEVRFCRRILAKLASHHPSPTSPAPPTRPDPDLSFTSRIPPHILQTLSHHLFTSPPLASTRTGGFATLPRLIRTCMPPSSPRAPDLDGWRAELDRWVSERLDRGDDCLEACVSAVNPAERRGLVDEWEI